MKNLKKIVMVIDADNTQLSKLEAVIQEVSAKGRIVVKRAYGNWRKEESEELGGGTEASRHQGGAAVRLCIGKERHRHGAGDRYSGPSP